MLTLNKQVLVGKAISQTYSELASNNDQNDFQVHSMEYNGLLLNLEGNYGEIIVLTENKTKPKQIMKVGTVYQKYIDCFRGNEIFFILSNFLLLWCH